MASETYLTKETLLKAVEAIKLASVAPPYAKYEDFLKFS